MADLGQPSVLAKCSPPVTIQILRASIKALSFLNFHWINNLSDLTIAIVVGAILALPLMILIIWLQTQNHSLLLLFVLCAIVAVFCLLRVFQAHVRQRHQEDIASLSERKDQFRRNLVQALRSRTWNNCSYSALVTEHRLTRVDADQIADELYIRAVITKHKEGGANKSAVTRLAALAKVLEIDDPRAEQLQAKGIAEASSIRSGKTSPTLLTPEFIADSLNVESYREKSQPFDFSQIAFESASVLLGPSETITRIPIEIEQGEKYPAENESERYYRALAQTDGLLGPRIEATPSVDGLALDLNSTPLGKNPRKASHVREIDIAPPNVPSAPALATPLNRTADNSTTGSLPPKTSEPPARTPPPVAPIVFRTVSPIPPSPRKAVLPSWQGRGTELRVGEYFIRDPLTYFASSTPRIEEASCIDQSLPIGKPVIESKGSLGYYPSYSRLTPGQRANYMNWMSRGRTGELHDIGYAFLFFYGLERRLLIERLKWTPKSRPLNPIS